MNQSKIAVRYAKALFLVTEEKNSTKSVKEDMEFLMELSAIPDFTMVMESPTISTKQKQDAVKALTNKKVQPLTSAFLDMLIENKRELYLQAICRNFINRYRDKNGIKAATITTAVKLDDKLISEIQKSIKQMFNTEVEMTTKQNENILGGFVLRVGDKQIDASVSSKLKNIERSFLNATV